jgi:AraC family transcriptional regulator
MASLQSGVFYIKGTKFEECEPHVTRLSLNFNLDNSQSYFIGRREFKVSPGRFLLINEGQSFTTFSDSETESRMITLAFKVGLADELFQIFSATHEQLLEGTGPGSTRSGFFEQTYAVDNDIRQRLFEVTKHDCCDEDELQEKLDNILLKVMFLQTDIRKKIDAIGKIKPSTRAEIYRRMQHAFEFVHNNFDQRIVIEDIARGACLSVFHFKRLFKEIYLQAPYQYIKFLRIEKAKDLLRKGVPVGEVCLKVGWQDSSSFVRLFRKEVGVTPERFRK